MPWQIWGGELTKITGIMEMSNIVIWLVVGVVVLLFVGLSLINEAGYPLDDEDE